MRWIILLAALPLPAQHTLYTCTASTQDYVVGSKLPVSGLFLKSPSGQWRHAGYNHPFLYGIDADPRDPSTVYLAAGNGLIRTTAHGEKWKILTGGEVTELRDVSLDPNAPATIYFAHSAGIRVSHDAGATWQDASAGLRRKYTEAIRVDRQHAGVVLAGTELGVFRSADGGKSWRLAGASGYQIMHLEQSPHNPCFWLAITQKGGIFASTDCGLNFESLGRTGVDRNLYDLAFDPTSPTRIAVAGWYFGVAVSEDSGKTWQFRNAGLPRTDVWSVVFDPDKPGRLYAGVQEDGLYVSDSSNSTWTKAGLDGSVSYRMKFLAEATAP